MAPILVSNIKSDIATATTGLTWIQVHERILTVALFLGTGAWLGNHYLNNTAANDKVKANTAIQQLADQKSQDAQLAAQMQQTATQYKAMVDSLTNQNAQLASSIATRTVVLQQTQAADRTLNAPALGQKLASIGNVPQSDITTTPDTVTVNTEGARQTVTDLEQVPALQADLADEQTVADNRQKELNQANTMIDGLNQQVTGLNTTVTEQDKTCKAELASVNASARKGKAGWFVKGMLVGAGVVTALALHF